MKKHSLNIRKDESGSAAVRKTYSPEELAEVFKTSRDDFMGIDLEEATLNWNPNYIFLFLKQIDNLAEIDDAVEWMIGFWEEKKGLYDSFDNKLSLTESHAVFKETLKSIRNSLAEWIEKKEKKARLREKMLHDYTQKTITIEQEQAKATEVTQTVIPAFNTPTQPAQGNGGVTYSVKLEELPKNIRNKVVVSQQVFDAYVKQLNEDLWLTVEKEKTRLCGCLFFLSNFYNITSRDTTADEFGQLAHHIIVALKTKGSITSSIRRREETIEKNIKRSYLCYANADVNKNMEKEIFMLRNDCKLLLDGFQPVLEAMENEKRVASEATNQAIQASPAV